MSHTALARKYRPTRFADLVAQEHVAAGLTGAVAKDRVAHGYLLTGPRGVGKTSAARLLAMSLNCERQGESTPGEPCTECDSCRRIWAGSTNLDVVEIDAASHRGVDDARELRERAMYAASAPDRYKVYIVDEAHMLTREAWNALLKILEEPPPSVVFVFATTEPQKIANTTTAVLSRLQRFDFRSIGPEAIAQRLRQVADLEGFTVDDDALVLISRVANGAMRDALSVLDQVLVFGDGAVTAERVRGALGLIDDELYIELLDLVASRRSDAVFPLVARIVEQGADLGEFVAGCGEVLRAVLITRLGGKVEGLTEGLRSALGEFAPRYAEGDVLRMLGLLGEAEANIRKSPNARLHIETLLLHWTLLDRTVDLVDVIRSLQGGGAVAPPREPPRAEKPVVAEPDPKPKSSPSPPPESPAVQPPDAPSADRSATVDSLEGLRVAWASVVEAVTRESPLLHDAITKVRPKSLDGGRLELEAADAEAHVEGLQRKRRIIEKAVTKILGRPVQVVVVLEGEGAPPAGETPGRKRSTVEDDREARLRAYRAQDSTLDRMADALDLELSE
jgi:DNA polymerase-3 subunit gamma/tau